MQEQFDFRVAESDAAKLLPPGVGTTSVSGIARRLRGAVGDSLWNQVARIDSGLRADENAPFVLSWEIHRKYSANEVSSAELLHVWPRKIFEPAGEECGTIYDESPACSFCGAGAIQTSPLRLDGRRIPRSVDFATTIAGEIVVTSRVADVRRRSGSQGRRRGHPRHLRQ